MKSRFDILLDRYVLTEKNLETSLVFSTIMKNHSETVRFMEILDSNKIVILTYPDNKHVTIHLRIILHTNEFDNRIIRILEEDIERKKERLRNNIPAGPRNNIPTEPKLTNGIELESVEPIDSHCIFGYMIVTTGTVILDAILKGEFNSSIRLEGLKLEKLLTQWGKISF